MSQLVSLAALLRLVSSLVVGVVEQEAVVLEGQQLVQLAFLDFQVDIMGMVLLA